MTGLGERLKQVRGGQSQAVFAKKLGLTQVAYSRYEADLREPSLDTIYQIGILNGVSADWLLGLPSAPAGTATGTGAIVGSGNTVTINTANPAADCDNCKFKRLAEALKAVQG